MPSSLALPWRRDRAPASPLAPRKPFLGVGASGTAKERVRDEIRAEIAKRNPIESARAPLELIAETTIRFVEDDGPVRYKVVDAEGHPRTKVENGVVADFTIQDLVAELQAAHPTLFQAAEPEPPTQDEAKGTPAAPSGSPAPMASDASVSREHADVTAAARDWLILDPGARSPASAAPPAPDQRADANARPQAGGSTGEHATDRDRRAPEAPSTNPTLAQPSPARRPPQTLAATRDPPASRRVLYGALAGVFALSLTGYLLLGSDPGAPPPTPTAANQAPPPARAAEPPRATAPTPEPTATGTVAPQPSASQIIGPVSGVPEVIDTSTLRFDGKVVRIFGVEWARGGQPEDLTRYLRGREVACQPGPAAGTHRCQVNGRDLSEVVLFNGGGRATPNATPELVAAEAHARAEKLGVWRK